MEEEKQMAEDLSQEEAKEKKQRFSLFKISTVDKIFFVQNIEVLIRAGFALSNALTTVAEQTKQKRLKAIIESIAADVESGQTFAEALRKYENMFDALFINMIESGEMSGKLESTLKQLTVQLKKSHILYLKVRNALAYPVIIMIAMVIVGIGMMIFVMPKIVDLYSGSSYTLPIATRIVIFISNFIIQNGILSAVIALVIIGISILLYRKEKVKLFIHRLILRIPIFGKIIREFNIARFSRVFHSLITTDIPIVQAFSIIQNTLGNRAYRKHINQSIPELEKGIAIGETLSDDELLFPQTAIKIITIGETSGTLEEMANEVAEHYEQEVASALDRLSVLIEPLLMLLLGLGVAIIAVAVLWPMYNLVNVI